MNEPEQQVTSRSTPRGCCGETEHCVDSRKLMSPDGQCRICHDGQQYQLRVTASNKLILTK